MDTISTDPVNADRYAARFHRLLEHIDANLGETLSVDQLAAVAAFSSFHFHRQFAARFGIGVHRYVQLCRFRRAAYRLAFRRTPIVDIALECGYAAPEAFSRAFKQCVGQSPSAFRRQPQWMAWQRVDHPVQALRSRHMPSNYQLTDVRMTETKDIPVAMMEHRGPPQGIGETVRRFIAWRRRHKLHPRVSATYNLLFHDPETTPADDFRLGLCAATSEPIADDADGITATVIPGGRCAVLRVTGGDERLRDALAFLYRRWLPDSGEETLDFPPYLRRVAFFPDVPQHEAVTDVYLPLAPPRR